MTLEDFRNMKFLPFLTNIGLSRCLLLLGETEEAALGEHSGGLHRKNSFDPMLLPDVKDGSFASLIKCLSGSTVVSSGPP